MSDALLTAILTELRGIKSQLEKSANGGTPQLRSPKDAAALLGVSTQTLLAKIQRGEWPGMRCGRYYKVSVEAVHSAMAIEQRVSP